MQDRLPELRPNATLVVVIIGTVASVAVGAELKPAWAAVTVLALALATLGAGLRPRCALASSVVASLGTLVVPTTRPIPSDQCDKFCGGGSLADAFGPFTVVLLALLLLPTYVGMLVRVIAGTSTGRRP